MCWIFTIIVQARRLKLGFIHTPEWRLALVWSYIDSNLIYLACNMTLMTKDALTIIVS